MNTRGNDVVAACLTPLRGEIYGKSYQTIKMKKIIRMIIFILIFEVSKIFE